MEPIKVGKFLKWVLIELGIFAALMIIAEVIIVR